MAATTGLTLVDVSKVPIRMNGGHIERIVDITFDSSYPTGGEALTAASLGLTTVHSVVLELSTNGYLMQYDRTNSKLLAYYADHSATVAGALIQVATAVDLSAESVRALVIGV